MSDSLKKGRQKKALLDVTDMLNSFEAALFWQWMSIFCSGASFCRDTTYIDDWAVKNKRFIHKQKEKKKEEEKN